MPVPSDIKLHRRSQILEVVFSDLTCELPAEFLRVHSPSAEVRGHGGPGSNAYKIQMYSDSLTK